VSDEFIRKMDSIRERMGATESPEERAKRQKQLVLPNILSLSLSIAMVVIGYQVSISPTCYAQLLPS